jgi:5'-3' exonuclease
MVDAAILAGCDFTLGVNGISMKAAINYMQSHFDRFGFQRRGITPQTVESIREVFTPPEIDKKPVTPQITNLRGRMMLECGMDESEVIGLLASYLENLKTLNSILSLIQVNPSSPS